MASTPTRLMTFAEFEQMPNHPTGAHYELRNGEPVLMPPPIHGHRLAQWQIWHAFHASAGDSWRADLESAYRPVPDYEYWFADVALIARERWDRIPRKGNLQGPPEIVVEVLSPSNTKMEILRKRKICLENGTREFWVVDADHRKIEVTTFGDSTITYTSGQQIPLFFAPGVTIAVDEIFT